MSSELEDRFNSLVEKKLLNRVTSFVLNVSDYDHVNRTCTLKGPNPITQQTITLDKFLVPASVNGVNLGTIAAGETSAVLVCTNMSNIKQCSTIVSFIPSALNYQVNPEHEKPPRTSSTLNSANSVKGMR